MTVKRLHEMLGDLVRDGHGRKKVMISKTTFTHPLEADGCTILPVETLEIHTYGLSDDDGGTKVTTRGVECNQTSCVLYGNNPEQDES